MKKKLQISYVFVFLATLFVSCTLYSNQNVDSELLQQRHYNDESEIIADPGQHFLDDFDSSIIIPARTPELSLRDFPFYAHVVWAYLYDKKLKPTYFKIVGFLSQLKNTLIA